jgi:hypothetical protein
MSEEYSPDNWVMLKITHENGFIYKILATWYGGFAGSDYWKLNSGVTRVEETDHGYLFYGSSGSIYRCGKQHYRLNMLGSSVLERFRKSAEASTTTIEMMDDDTNFMEINYE